MLYSSIGRGCVEWLISTWTCFGALCHAWEYLTLFLRGGALDHVNFDINIV